jgi:NAD(P) transhydrogenase subunit alpha
MSLTLGVPRELSETEKRVALVPEVISKFRKLGVQVVVEAGAGEGALLPDTAFDEAEVLASTDELYQRADVMLFVSPPDSAAINRVSEGSVVVGFMAAHTDPERVKLMRDRKITAFSVELIPRISRAQSMDALSSQASVAGYKAVLLAAQTSGKFFPMLTTAAGTIRPSKVLIIGAGVAGLQALATARRLGAITFGYDVRPETREQIESLGAKFIDLSVQAAGEGGYARELTDEERQQQQEALAEHIARMNVVITTAAIPGRPAPKIITQAMVEGMTPGSVIIDIAAETGGNCDVTRAGETVIHKGVSIVGPVNLASQLAMDSSEMYARNLYNYLSPMISEGQFEPDWEDQVMAESVLTHAGEIKHQKTRELVEGDDS